MNHPQFEAIKVAIKQDKTGYILTLNIHPDDIDERILRDFVGARYQVVMVRLNDEGQPMNRKQVTDYVMMAGILCRDKMFHKFLFDRSEIFDPSEQEAAEWLKSKLGISSRAELKSKPEAVQGLLEINEDYQLWKQND